MHWLKQNDWQTARLGIAQRSTTPNFERRDKQRERERQQRESPKGQFDKLLKQEFPNGYGYYRFFGEDALFQCDSCFHSLPEERDTGGHMILIRLLYVIRSQRGNGVALRLLNSLIDLSEETGLCLFAVCSPFERLGDPNQFETVLEVAKHFSRSEFSISEIVGESCYAAPQRRMGKRFMQAGFRQIDAAEAIADKNKFTPEHCWIYIPDSCDTQFSEAMEKRMLK